MRRYLENTGIGSPDGAILNAPQILEELSKSDRWGINLQPEDPSPLAAILAELRCVRLLMKADDTCVAYFAQALTEEQAELLVEVAQQEESPFAPAVPKTEAFLW